MPIGNIQATQYIPCLLLLPFKIFIFQYCRQKGYPTALGSGENKGFHMDVLSLQMSAKWLSRIVTFSSIKFFSTAFPPRIVSYQALSLLTKLRSNDALCENICREMPPRKKEKKNLFTSSSRFPSPETIMLLLQSYKAKSIWLCECQYKTLSCLY